MRAWLVPFALTGILAAGGCSLVEEIRRTPKEANFAVTIDANQLVLTTTTVEGRPGRFVVASAHPVTLLSSRFVTEHGLHRLLEPYSVTLGERETRNVDPNVVDLGPSIDALIGSDVLGPALTIDYPRGIVTVSRTDRFIDKDMSVFRFRGLPSIEIGLDGRPISVVVDTALPDTLVIPPALAAGRSPGDRFGARVRIAGWTWDGIDVAVEEVSEPRLGNRLLGSFLIAIDYRRQLIGLWPYGRPRS